MPENTKVAIRRAQPKDYAKMARIAFLTGDAGKTAEGKMSLEELPGLIYVLPYLELGIDGCAGFVLVESVVESGAEEVVGYTLACSDSLVFREVTEEKWWPSLREKYPSDPTTKPAASDEVQSDEEWSKLTDLDRFFLSYIHHPKPFQPACLAFSSAHAHINILPGFQGQGWGRKLFGRSVAYLRDERELEGVFLGIAPGNVSAAKFYERVGFRYDNVRGAEKTYFGLKFDEFVEK